MTVLVTGGTGAMGSWVVRELIERGERPLVYDLRPDFKLLSDLTGRFDFIEGDVLDGEALGDALRGGVVATVVHMAGVLTAQEHTDPARAFQVNTMGTVNVLEAAVANGVRRVVYSSSRAAFGPLPEQHTYPSFVPVTEDLPCNPRNIYDITKLACEHLLGYYARRYGIETAALRFPNLYGPGRMERHGGRALTSKLIENAVAGVASRVPGGAEWRDDVLYTRDCARALVQACTQPLPEHPVYLIGSGRLTSLPDVAAAVQELFPAAEITIGPGPYTISTQACVFDTRRAERELDYRPSYDLRTGIRDYVDTMARLQIAPAASTDWPPIPTGPWVP